MEFTWEQDSSVARKCRSSSCLSSDIVSQRQKNRFFGLTISALETTHIPQFGRAILRFHSKWAGSKVVFIVLTEISDNVLKGAETRGFNGMVNGFHQGILRLAMEPSLWGTAFMEHGPDTKIKFDRRPGVDDLYIEGYIQAMLDVRYKQEHVRVKVTEDEVILENLPPNNFVVNEIMEHVKSFLMSEALWEGKPTMSTSPPHHLQGDSLVNMVQNHGCSGDHSQPQKPTTLSAYTMGKILSCALSPAETPIQTITKGRTPLEFHWVLHDEWHRCAMCGVPMHRRKSSYTMTVRLGFLPSGCLQPRRIVAAQNRLLQWKIRPMLANLCEHLFVNFSIRWLRKLVSKVIPDIEPWGRSQEEIGTGSKIVPSSSKKETKTNQKWSVGGFLLSSVLAYLNGRLCRRIPNPIARRIVSGFMLSFVDNDSS